MISGCCIRNYAETQATISLSSRGTDLHGIAQGLEQTRGAQVLLKDKGWAKQEARGYRQRGDTTGKEGRRERDPGRKGEGEGAGAGARVRDQGRGGGDRGR